jgi:hypothetical protein
METGFFKVAVNLHHFAQHFIVADRKLVATAARSPGMLHKQINP